MEFYLDIKWMLLISFVLSLDAFSVAITCGIKLKTFKIKKYLKIALHFAAFQAGMPILGWIGGQFIQDYVEGYVSWIIFFVFLILGIKTIYESLVEKKHAVCDFCNCDNFKCLYGFSFATSSLILIFRTSLAISADPFFPPSPVLKKYFNSNNPIGVCIYLFVVALETEDS